jgi:hypothetical protein
MDDFNLDAHLKMLREILYEIALEAYGEEYEQEIASRLPQKAMNIQHWALFSATRIINNHKNKPCSMNRVYFYKYY